MAPTSKPKSESKAKFTSATKIKKELLKSRKPAVSFKKNDMKSKQQLLKGRKPVVSSSSKENHKKFKQDLLKVRKPAVSSSAKENHAQLKKLEAENDALRKTLAVKERVTNKIPRPEKGNAGNGFNLQEAMGLADDVETYTLLRRTVRDLAAQAGLDCSVLWCRQPKDIITKIIGAARERHSFFKRFPHGWAIEEFLKSSLKNKRAYARKRGYLKDKTNRGIESDEENDSGNDGDGGADDSRSDQGSDDLNQGGNEAGSDNGTDDNIEDDQGSNGSGGGARASDDAIESDIYF